MIIWAFFLLAVLALQAFPHFINKGMILLFFPSMAQIAKHHLVAAPLFVTRDLMGFIPFRAIHSLVFKFLGISSEILSIVGVRTSSSVVVIGERAPHCLVGIHEKMVTHLQQMQLERNKDFIVIVCE